MEQRISLITLGVADLARARSFYGALGWKQANDDADVVFFQAGGAWCSRSGVATSSRQTPAFARAAAGAE